MIKQKEIIFNNDAQEPVLLSSIFVKSYNFDGKKTMKATIKASDLDKQLDFGQPLPIQTEDENGEVKDIYFEIRFTESSDFKLKSTFKEGYYKLKSNNLWIDNRPNEKGIVRNILRVANVQEFNCYYEIIKK